MLFNRPPIVQRTRALPVPVRPPATAPREVVRANRAHGLTKLDRPEYVNRLDDVATRLDRTVDAVRKRAQRIGAYSYGPAPARGD